MQSIQTRIRPWHTLAWWTLASLVGWVTGMAMGALLTTVGSRLFGLNEDRALAYITLLSVGLACGAAQSMTLKSYLPNAFRWILVTLAGYLLAMGIMAAASGARIVANEMTNAILLVLLGAVIGIPQWLELRSQFRGAGLWVPANAAGFLAFLALVARPASSMGEFIAAGAILGALAAVPPGILLARMVRQAQVAIS